MKPGSADEIKLQKVARKFDSVMKQFVKQGGNSGISPEFYDYLCEEHPGFMVAMVGLQRLMELEGKDAG